MRTTRTEEITTCDNCNKEIVFTPRVCNSCGVEHCCVCTSGGIIVEVKSREVYYCKKCHNSLTDSSSDPVYSTIVEIDGLEKEWDRISREYTEKQRELVDKLEKLLPKPYF
jgi:hypothetical protein